MMEVQVSEEEVWCAGPKNDYATFDAVRMSTNEAYSKTRKNG